MGAGRAFGVRHACDQGNACELAGVRESSAPEDPPTPPFFCARTGTTPFRHLRFKIAIGASPAMRFPSILSAWPYSGS